MQSIGRIYKWMTDSLAFYAITIVILSLWSSFFIFTGIVLGPTARGFGAMGTGIVHLLIMTFSTVGMFAVVKSDYKPSPPVGPVEFVELEKPVEVIKIVEVPPTIDVTDRSGYVYVVRGVNTNWYKIGHSKEPEQRIRRFEVIIPIELETELYLETDDRIALESILHSHFRDKHVSGEWYELNNHDLAWLHSAFRDKENDS